MKDPNMRARVGQLHKKEAEWAKLVKFIPLQGEVVVFDPDTKHPYARVKIGDGSTYLKDLPFFIDSAITDYFIKHRLDEDEIDAGRVSDYKK